MICNSKPRCDCKSSRECAVSTEFKCLTYDGRDLSTIGVESGDNGNRVLNQIDRAIDKSKAKIANVGAGSSLYNGLSDDLIHEFKSLLASDGVIIEEKEKILVFKVDENFLKKWLDKNLRDSLTGDMLKGIFNESEFKTFFSSYLMGIISRPEVRAFFEEYLWSIFGSQSFQEKFIDFLKVIYNEDKWKSFYEDYLRMMFNRSGFKNFFSDYLQAVFNTGDFKEFLEGYLSILFQRQGLKNSLTTLIMPLINAAIADIPKDGLDSELIKAVVASYLESEDFCKRVKQCVPNTFEEDLRKESSKNYIKSLFDEFSGNKDLKPQLLEAIKEYLKNPEFKGVIKGLFNEFLEENKSNDLWKPNKVVKDATLNDVVYNEANRVRLVLSSNKFEASYVDPTNDEPFSGRSIKFADSLGGRLKYDGRPVVTGQEVASFDLNKLTYEAKDQNPSYTERVDIVLI